MSVCTGIPPCEFPNTGKVQPIGNLKVKNVCEHVSRRDVIVGTVNSTTVLGYLHTLNHVYSYVR